MRYLALLRGINIGGRNRILMEDIRARLSVSFPDVSTYLQTGNILFEAQDLTSAEVKAQVELELIGLGDRIEAIVRSASDLEDIVRQDPFTGAPESPSHQYVTFLSQPSDASLPAQSPNGDVQVLLYHGLQVYSTARLVGTNYGFPNAFVERKLKTPATTRNWNVVRALAGLL